MVADIQKIVFGDVDIRSAPESTPEPLLGTGFFKAVTGSQTDTIVLGQLTAGSGLDLFEGSAGAVGGVAADMTITAATDGATTDLTISDVSWNTSLDDGLVITGTLPASSTTGGFPTEVASGGALEDTSIYIQFDSETLDLKTQPLADGTITRADIVGDMAELCRCEAQPRKSNSQITVFKSVGAAIEDFVAARMTAAS